VAGVVVHIVHCTEARTAARTAGRIAEGTAPSGLWLGCVEVGTAGMIVHYLPLGILDTGAVVDRACGEWSLPV
jgi:hypothetical protein